MENSEVIEKLVDIHEEVSELKRKPEIVKLARLISLIEKSQKLILEFNPRKNKDQERVIAAYVKMVEVEEQIRDYTSLDILSLPVSELEGVFQAYQKAYESFFWDR